MSNITVFERRWNFSYDCLRAYIEEHNGKYPALNEMYHELKLGNWLSSQIHLWNGGKLKPHRKKALSQLPAWDEMILDANKGLSNLEIIWNEKYKMLEDYLQEHNGKYPVRREMYKGINLGNWVVIQAGEWKKGNLSPTRRAAIKGLPNWDTRFSTIEGFSKQEADWRKKYGALTDYLQEHSGKYPEFDEMYEGLHLGHWASYQLRCCQTGKITEDKRGALSKLPNWDVQNKETRPTEKWEKPYWVLAKYIEEHNGKYPPSNEMYEGLHLGRWTASQIRSWRTGKINNYKKGALSKLPNWDARVVVTASTDRTEAIWERNYQVLVEYIEEHDGIYPSHGERYNGFSIGSWLSIQVRTCQAGKLKSSRRAALEKLPNWKNRKYQKYSREVARQKALAERLMNYTKAFGKNPQNTYVCDDGYYLGRKLCYIRQKYRKGELQPDIIHLFEESGMTWRLREERVESQFEQSVSELAIYKETYGNIDAHQRYVAPSGYRLGEHIQYLRVKRKKGLLSKKQIEQLNNMGMIWQKASSENHGYSHTVSQQKDLAKRLMDYTKASGKTPPYSYVCDDGYRLGTKLCYIRGKYWEDKLQPDIIRLFEESGMTWETRKRRVEYTFEQSVSELAKYKKTYGSIVVKRRYVAPSGYRLGAYIQQLRIKRKKGQLSKEQIEQLDNLGMIWLEVSSGTHEYSPEVARQKILAERLMNYTKAFGKMPPRNYVCDDGYYLGSKIYYIRKNYKKGKLQPDIIHLFEESGMTWDIREKGKPRTFEKSVSEIAAYKETYGDINVKKRYVAPSGCHLGAYICGLRRKRKKGLLSKEQIEQLDNMGMIWSKGPSDNREYSPEVARQKTLAERLMNYTKAFGKMPPGNYVCDDGYYLGSKLYYIRKNYKNGKLQPDIIHLFEESGMTWDIQEKGNTFEESVSEIAAYKETYGDINVKRKYVAPSGYHLGTYIHHLRFERKKGLLSKEQIEQLDNMGMIWSKAPSDNREYSPEVARQKTLAERLMNYTKAFGEMPPSTYVCDDGYNLGRKLWYIRKKYRKGELQPDIIRLFEESGMAWGKSGKRGCSQKNLRKGEKVSTNE